MSLLEDTLAHIEGQDREWRARARARLEQLTMPHWALGRLMDLAQDLAGMCRSLRPRVANKAVVIMAADHGVAARGVSKYPQEVTAQMVYNFAAGGAGINALAGVAGAHVVVADLGVAADLSGLSRARRILDRKVAPGTADISRGPAMSRAQAVRAVEAGIGIALDFAPGVDVFATGDMGIANTTPSSAILAAMTGCTVEDACGPGTGIEPERIARKVEVVREALSVNRPDPADALDLLAKVGGFEIGGLAGLVLGAARLRKPVIVDGFISTAAALLAQGLAPPSGDYMIAAHNSAEPGHRRMLDKLGKQGLLDLDLRLGEGTGAALAMPLVDAAAAVLTRVATFEEAGVSEAE